MDNVNHAIPHVQNVLTMTKKPIVFGASRITFSVSKIIVSNAIHFSLRQLKPVLFLVLTLLIFYLKVVNAMPAVMTYMNKNNSRGKTFANISVPKENIYIKIKNAGIVA